MNVDVISKATGATTQVSIDAIDLDAPSIVRLNLSRAEVAGIERQGHDLIVHLANGEDIRIVDFYPADASLPNDLVLRENDGTLWAARVGDGAPRFSLIDDLDALMAAQGGGGSSLTLPLALLGGLGAAGLAVAAASGGGDSDRGEDDDSSGNPANPGPGPGPGTVAPDREAPAAPSGTIRGDGSQISGRGEPGATVEVRDAVGTVIGSAVVAADGSYTIPLSPPQADGQPLVVTQTDPAGNTSAATSLTAPDITAPVAPTAAIDATGATVTGRGEAGATVTIRNPAGTVIATAIVAAEGTYSATLSPAQANGGTLSVVQTDAAGNASPAITLPAPDITAPTAPTAAVDPIGTTVSGRGEAGATVTIRDAASTVIGSAVVLADGTYVVSLTPAQAKGGSVSVIQTDTAGNISAATVVPAPDITAPAAPTAAIDATGAIVSGRGEAGSTVTIREAAGAVIGTAVVGADGTFTAPLTPAQANGGTLSVVQTDAAGNASSSAVLLAPDITAPAPPSATVNGTGTTVSGMGEAGATVTVRDPAGAVIGAAVVTTDGSYTVTLNPPQANGGTLSVSQSDPAGNASPGITIAAPDVTAPAAPTITIDATGTQVSGVGEPGATVRIANAAGASLGTATVGADGRYMAMLAAPQVNGERLDAVQTDAAGNISGRATTVAPDLTAPAQPTAAISGDGDRKSTRLNSSHSRASRMPSSA